MGSNALISVTEQLFTNSWPVKANTDVSKRAAPHYVASDPTAHWALSSTDPPEPAPCKSPSASAKQQHSGCWTKQTRNEVWSWAQASVWELARTEPVVIYLLLCGLLEMQGCSSQCSTNAHRTLAKAVSSAGSCLTGQIPLGRRSPHHRAARKHTVHVPVWHRSVPPCASRHGTGPGWMLAVAITHTYFKSTKQDLFPAYFSTLWSCERHEPHCWSACTLADPFALTFIEAWQDDATVRS